MIAISDIVILTVSSALLAVALTRSFGASDATTSNPAPQPRTTQTQNATQNNTAQSNNQVSDQTQSTANTTQLQNDTESQATSQTVEPIVVETEPQFSTHTVRSGDSLSQIASRYGTTVAKLQELNDLSGTRILVGQKLRYPEL